MAKRERKYETIENKRDIALFHFLSSIVLKLQRPRHDLRMKWNRLDFIFRMVGGSSFERSQQRDCEARNDRVMDGRMQGRRVQKMVFAYTLF